MILVGEKQDVPVQFGEQVEFEGKKGKLESLFENKANIRFEDGSLQTVEVTKVKKVVVKPSDKSTQEQQEADKLNKANEGPMSTLPQKQKELEEAKLRVAQLEEEISTIVRGAEYKERAEANAAKERAKVEPPREVKETPPLGSPQRSSIVEQMEEDRRRREAEARHPSVESPK